MGTRSDVIVHRADGKWTRVYCHWDGYVAHNGRILFDHYKTRELAESLVALGDLSVLGPVIGRKHDFDWRQRLSDKYRPLYHAAREAGLSVDEAVEKERQARKGDTEYAELDAMCLYYGRDRGESGTEAALFDTLMEAWPGSETGTEFTYVFCAPEDGSEARWFVGDPDEGTQTLKDLGAVLRGEEDEPKTAIKAFGGNFVIGHR